jgi:hypothetical protein
MEHLNYIDKVFIIILELKNVNLKKGGRGKIIKSLTFMSY